MGAYILKVTIEDTHPPVWRRLIVPEKITYEDLHRILQIAFGWEEAHLHDFSFPNTNYRVVMSHDDMEFGDCVLEKNTLIDEDLMDFRWIRYTYDFGDDWRHKIVFEKKDPSYKERFAQVIKWKGDNFAEDIGGVYGAYMLELGSEYDEDEDDEYEKEEYDEYEEFEDEDDWVVEPRIPFDPDAVNKKLAAKTFPTRRSKKGGRSGSGRRGKSGDASYKKILDQLLESFFKEKALEEELKGLISEQEKPAHSAMQTMIEKWLTFSDGFAEEIQRTMPDKNVLGEKGMTVKEFMNSIPNDPAPIYEQMALPGFPSVIEQTDSHEVRAGIYSVKCSIGIRSMEENLNRLSEKESRDYCKYLRTPYNSGTKKEREEAFCKEIKAHPEYLRLILSYESLECLMSMAGLRNQRYRTMGTEPVAVGIALGLIECRTRNTKKAKKAELVFAKDAPELLLRAADTDLEACYKELDEQDNRILPLIDAYGVIEIHRLYEFCKELAGITMTKKEFERFIYLHLRFPDRIKTFYDRNDTAYAALDGIDVERVMRTRQRCCREQDYKKLSSSSYKNWQKGFLNVYEEWQDFCVLIAHFAEERHIPMEHTADLLKYCYEIVFNGGTVYELCAEVCRVMPPCGLTGYLLLWENAVGVVLTTGLPALKGYSRISHVSEFGEPDVETVLGYEDYLRVFRGDDAGADAEEIDRETHLFEFSESAAEELAEVMGYVKNPSSAVTIRDLNELMGPNEELQLIQVSMEMEQGNKEEAKILLDDLIMNHEGWTGDLEELRKSMFPSIRTDPKIYPNDPCPCGSGKKYKKCCGKKK